MNKRLVLALLVIFVAITAIPVVGEGSEAPSGQVNIICFAGEVAHAVRELSKDYMKENPNVEVVMHELAFGTAQEKMWQDFAVKGGTYDIIVMLNFWFARASKFGHLQSIQGYIDKDKRELNLKDYPAPVIGTTQIDGENYGFPLQAGDMLVYYRKDKLEDPKEKADFKAKYGYDLRPPVTWKEYLDVAKFFYRPEEGFYGNAAHGKETVGLAWHLAMYKHTEGEEIFDKNWKPLLDIPTTVEYIKWKKKTFETSFPGAIAVGDDEAAIQFLQGNAALLYQWGDVGPRVHDPAQTILKPSQVGYSFIPKGMGSNARYAPFFAMWSTVLSQYSKNSDAAYDFMSWLSLHDEKFLQLGGIPCRDSTYRDPEMVARFPHLSTIADSMPYAKSLPRFPEWSDVSSATARAISLAITGKLSPEEGAKMAQKEVYAIMEEAGYYD